MKIKCSVAGITFRNKGEEFTTLRPEGELTLRHDPKNEYDQNAIEIYYEGTMLGYIKKDSYAQEFLKSNPSIDTATVTGYAYAEGDAKNLTFNDEHVGRLGAVRFEIVSGSDDVTLDEDNNYIIGEDKCMRLSNVIAHFNPEPDNPGLDRWKIDHDDYDDYINDLNTRARAGTAMHNAIEKYIETGQTDILIPDGFWNFIKKHAIEFIESEALIHGDNGIAGRGDAGANATDGPKKAQVRKKVWIDWKSSKKPTKKHAIQNSWYATEKGYDEAWIVAFGAENKQGYSLMKIPYDKMIRLHGAVGLIKKAIDLING